jgi:hypothetical protein
MQRNALFYQGEVFSSYFLKNFEIISSRISENNFFSALS